MAAMREMPLKSILGSISIEQVYQNQQAETTYDSCCDGQQDEDMLILYTFQGLHWTKIPYSRYGNLRRAATIFCRHHGCR